MNLPVLDKLNPDVAALNPYEPGRPVEEVAREMGLNVNEIVKLASNESAIGTSPKAIAALQAALPESYRYPDGGAWHLRNKLAERYSVTRDQIAVGNGSNEILELIGHCFMTPGTSAVFSAHAFIVYKLVAQLFGIEQREIPMTDGLIHDLEAMLKAIDETTTVVFVCNPNNPTGTMAANDAIADFMSRVPDHVLVVFDEAYAEIALSEMPDTMQYVHAERSVIITRTFSKAYGLAGLRVGYGIAPAPVIAALQQARQPFNVNLLAQVAGCAALDDDAFIAAGRAVYRAGRTTIEDACKELGLRFIPTQANFMLIEAGRKGTADMNGGAVTQALQERGVIVRPVAGYGLPQYFRVNFGTASENQRFVEALADVLKA